MKNNLNLLDTAIVVLSACTISIFLLWSSGEILRVAIFQNPPEYLKNIVHNVFAIITTGATGSVLAYILRRQIYRQEDRPHYLLYIAATTFLILSVIILLAMILPAILPKSSDKLDSSVVKISKSMLHDSTGKYVEYSIFGDFFTKGFVEPLTVQVRESATGLNKLIFKRNSNEVASTIESDKGQLLGFCRSKLTGRLNVIIEEVAAEDIILSAGAFDDALGKINFNQVKRGPEIDESNLSKVTCGSKEKWLIDDSRDLNTFTPCSCQFESLDSLNNDVGKFYDSVIGDDGASIYTAEGALPAEFFLGRSINFPGLPYTFSDEKLQEFLSELRRLGGRSPIVVKSLSLSNYDVKSIYVNQDSELSSSGVSWGMVIWRDRANYQWTVLMTAPSSSKEGLHVPAFVAGAARNEIVVSMCVDDCYFWMQDEDVVINFEKMTAVAANKSLVLKNKLDREPSFSLTDARCGDMDRFANMGLAADIADASGNGEIYFSAVARYSSGLTCPVHVYAVSVEEAKKTLKLDYPKAVSFERVLARN